MDLTRRTFVQAGLASALAHPLRAQTTLGDMTLTSVSDGSLTLPANMIMGRLAGRHTRKASAEV